MAERCTTFSNWFRFKQLKPQDLLGGNSVKENADILLAILKGKGTDAQNNVVLANAALAISIYEDNSYPAALSMAKQSLFEGKKYCQV